MASTRELVAQEVMSEAQAQSSTTLSDEEPLTGQGHGERSRRLWGPRALALGVSVVALSAVVFDARTFYPHADEPIVDEALEIEGVGSLVDVGNGELVDEAGMKYVRAFMFGLRLTEAVSQGWGHRIWLMGVMHERFVTWCEGTALVMPELSYNDFKYWGLNPPAITVPDDKFWATYKDHLEDQPIDPTFKTMVVGDWQGEELNGQWMAYQSTEAHMYQALMGCHQTFDDFVYNMFADVIGHYKKPIVGKYVGLHIRHGDKISEGRIMQFDDMMRMVRQVPEWSDIKDFFVATDDDNVLKHEISREHAPKDCVPLHAEGCYSITDPEICTFRRDGREDMVESDGYPVYGEPCVWCDREGDCGTGNRCEPLAYLQGKGLFAPTDWIARCPLSMTKAWSKEYRFKWTDYLRWAGGEPDTGVGGIYNHNHDENSIRAVVDDTMSLAYADVMVGSFNSNFFKLPWLLNYYRRTPEQRKEQWCWDAWTNSACNDRHDFVLKFLQSARDSGVPYLPDDTPILTNCMNPQQVQGFVHG